MSRNCIVCGKMIKDLDHQDTCSPVCWIKALKIDRKQGNVWVGNHQTVLSLMEKL